MARVFIASELIFVILAASQRWTILDLAFTLVSQKSALRSCAIMLLIFILAHDTWCYSRPRCAEASQGDENQGLWQKSTDRKNGSLGPSDPWFPDP